MATITLSADQVNEVLAPSKRYGADLYLEVLAGVRSAGKPLGHVEALFPGVKPAHVVFMLKQLRGDAKDVTIDSHGTYGVCVIPVVKPAARTRKPASAKPAAAKPARKPAGGKKRTTRKPA